MTIPFREFKPGEIIWLDEVGHFTKDHAYLLDQWKKESDMTDKNEPGLTLQEAKNVVATKKAPRVTEESIKERIATATYHHVDQLTICIITMVNGFHVTGTSAPASPANYDAEVGKRYAYDNAFKQLWQLEGYLLRDKLDQEARAVHEAKKAGTDGPA